LIEKQPVGVLVRSALNEAAMLIGRAEDHANDAE
jgi:hypothetical protein